MTNDEQILHTLKKMLEVQEQSFATQKQAYENQQKAINAQQTALKYQLATGRIYRISLAVIAAVLLYFLSHLGR